ncbi:proline-rich transmembrane protein 4 isoform X1 [Hemicordylus capensis]|uniref:proline-rich transmembrane protein 4 isoform X1 n=1 Tax=Hemicordylus capensis TaxID=884348 RepID=UPI0023027253|nr:proline-rich transmembrane protein 4 isoform X1 [Hemicordylus capensis]XP_053114043.1 proline-rich transmembrane protein 4 isoform X1 [Hemicordylus capensis]XP_053114044.1 proline-rich transmembrane protein 4 isoform X1 [Hemicordylus capensis]
MWRLLALLCLPPLGSGTAPNTLQPGALTEEQDDSQRWLQTPGSSRAPLGTPTGLPDPPDPPALSLNLGLNFKIKVRSQGKGWPGEGPGGASAKPGLPPTQPAAPTHSQAPVGRFWAEAPGGSGWLGGGPADELPPGPGGWAWDASPGQADPDLQAPAPTPQQPLTLWPRLAEKGLAGPPGEESKELEFKIDIDLMAGLGKEGRLAANSSGGGGGTNGRQYQLLPGLRLGISEIASRLGAPGLLGSTLPPEVWGPPEGNATGGARQQPGDSRPTPVGALEPGPESISLPASPGGSGGTLVALPGCLLDHPEDCSSPLPEQPGSPLLPAQPLSVPLHADWNTALAEWGPAWEAHLFGAGALFALLALLSLLALLALPCCCPAGCTLLALLHLLLLGAGGARAVLLFGEACGQLELFPALAVRLLHELALPCLTSALAATLLLLSRRPCLKLSRSGGRRHSCLLGALLLLHFSVATGAALAADLLPHFPFLLLASRGLFALLAAVLSASFLVFFCLARGETAQAYDLKSSTLPACRCPLASARQWRRAACTALPAASFGLLSAALHTYAILHALGYGLRPQLFGPWAWWGLQLAGRLCEAGLGLPLALLGLCPAFCSPREAGCRCCGQLLCLSPGHAVAKSHILPGNCQWALNQHEKLVVCDTITRSESDYLPLYGLPAGDPRGGQLGWGRPEARAPSLPSIALDANDPTADFRPPSPIDLRRSIDEALCSEGLFPGGSGSGALYASSPLSLRLARGPWLESDFCRTASCLELAPASSSQAEGGPSLGDTSGPHTSPGHWRGSSCSSSPGRHSATEASTLALGSSPGQGTSTAGSSPPRSPPPPGRQYWARGPVSQESLASSLGPQPGADTALLQEEFMDVCRQIDALSVSSDTIDL